MKYSAWGALALLLLTTPCLALTKHIYGDVQVTNISPSSDFVWERDNTQQPQYPIELARSRIAGCTVLSFDISETGDTENIEVINSVPHYAIGKYSKQILKTWKWAPTSTVKTAEKRTVRLDYCLGETSSAESEKQCKQQAQLACS